MAESVPLQHIGKIYAIVFMAASAGVSVGPMISGVLFQLGGYWAAWSSAFAIIGVDIIFRLLMIEKPIHEKTGERMTLSLRRLLFKEHCGAVF